MSTRLDDRGKGVAEMSRRVLVTGAGGFIGSHLVERLVSDGHRVRGLVRYNGRDDRGQLDRIPAEIAREVEVVRGDLKDPEAIRKAVDGCEWVMHLGALIAIPYSYQNPLDVVQTNVVGTAHVLDACRSNSALERVVLTSTSEVYGTARFVPIDETHPLCGQSPYAATKIGSDALGESYHRAFGLPVAILRPFNTFGPRQSARAIIPTIISQALAGDTLRLGSLSPRRDLTYVKDTAAGFAAIAACDAAIGQVVNIGRGDDLTIGDLVELIGKILGRSLRVESDPARIRPEASEVGRLLAGTAKATALWGWTPSYTLEQGLAETIEWVRANRSLFRVGEYTT
ncbi:MAG: GDP-mannose 4,6-dehydratase [Isosphaeraceae bacterium]|nr:GDP-mannose 4,6-dehydratase [Isosphaeraceae bacterium]